MYEDIYIIIANRNFFIYLFYGVASGLLQNTLFHMHASLLQEY
jgi:hypothetical protein